MRAAVYSMFFLIIFVISPIRDAMAYADPAQREVCKLGCDRDFERDSAECMRLPDTQRRVCQERAMSRYSTCLRDCDRRSCPVDDEPVDDERDECIEDAWTTFWENGA